MATIIQAAVSVGVAGTLLCSDVSRRRWIRFTNRGSVTVYAGGVGVSTSAFMLEIAAGEAVDVTMNAGDTAPAAAWYGVVASGSCAVSVGESLASESFGVPLPGLDGRG